MAQQRIGAVDVFGIDRRHDEGCGPHAGGFVIFGNETHRLGRPLEPRRQRERVLEQADDREILCRGRHRCFHAGGSPARECPLHLADTALDARGGGTGLGFDDVLQKQNSEVERDRIEPAAEDDPCAARFGGFGMGVDLVPHPRRFTAEIDISSARTCARRDQFVAVELIWADGGQHDVRPCAHRHERRFIRRVRDDQRGIDGRADQVAHFSELFCAPPCHRPAFAARVADQIFGDQPSGETGCAIDDQVELAGHRTLLFLFRVWAG